MDNIQIFLEVLMTFKLEIALLVAGIVIFLAGIVLLHKSGPWMGFLISCLGILLVIIAGLVKLFSS